MPSLAVRWEESCQNEQDKGDVVGRIYLRVKAAVDEQKQQQMGWQKQAQIDTCHKANKLRLNADERQVANLYAEVR